MASPKTRYLNCLVRIWEYGEEGYIEGTVKAVIREPGNRLSYSVEISENEEPLDIDTDSIRRIQKVRPKPKLKIAPKEES